MAQEIINIGSGANDGTGDELRVAFEKVNSNFTEIYTAGPVGSNVVISGNTITVTGTNNNVVLAGNGLGNIQANSSIQPAIDAVYNIGGPNSRFNTVYGAFFVGNGAGLTGVTASSGPFIANGTSNVTVVSSGGNVTIGIQTQSNVAVFGRYNTTLRGNLLPAANVTYDLGAPTAAWNDLYLSGNTIYLNTATITSNATAMTFTNELGGQFVLDGTGVFSQERIFNGLSAVDIPVANGSITMRVATTPNAMVVSTTGVTVTGQVSATGNIVGNYVLGNGAFLSGLPESYSNANVAAFLPTYSGVLRAQSANIIGNISTGTDVAVGGNLTVAGSFLLTNIDIAGNATVGTINTGNASLSGSVISPFRVANNVSATGNIRTDGFLFGDGGFISNVTVTGNVNATQLGNGSTVLSVAGPDGNLLGTVSGVANVLAATPSSLSTTQIFSATGNVVTDGFFIGNGRLLTGLSPNSIYNGNSEINIGVADGNANVTIDGVSNVVVFTTTGINVDGNVSANIVSANSIDTTELTVNAIRSDDSTAVVVEDSVNIQGDADVSGEVSAARVAARGNIVATGNISGGNIVTAGFVTTTSNVVGGNITTSGAVSAIGEVAGTTVSASGNVTGGNVNVPAGLISAAGNVTGNNIVAVQSVAGTTLSAAGNVIGANIQGGTLSLSGNVISDLNITTNVVGANITAVDTVTGATVSAAANVIGANIQSGTLSLSGNVISDLEITSNVAANNVSASNLIATDTVTGVTVSASANVIGANVQGGTLSLSGNVISDLNVTDDFEADRVTAGSGLFGNVFTTLIDSADSSVITVVPGVNFLTDVEIDGDATVDGLISVVGGITGTSASLDSIAANTVNATTVLAGTVNAGDISLSGNITSDLVVEQHISAIGNVSAVGNVFIQGITSAVGNIVTDGFFVGQFAGNITGNLTVPGGNTQVLYNNDGNAGAAGGLTYNSDSNTLIVLGIVSSQGNVIAGNVTTVGRVSATSNITGGNVNTAGLVTATGNVTGGNIRTAGLVTATGNVTGGNIITAGAASAASVSASGNVTGGNIVTAGLVTAAGNVTGGNLVAATQVSVDTLSVTNNRIDAVTQFAIATSNTVSGNSSSILLDRNGTGVAISLEDTGGGPYSWSFGQDNVLFPDGSRQYSAYGNANVAANLAAFGSNPITTTGNISGGNIGTGGLVSATGNVIGGNLTTTGTVAGANLSLTGNVDSQLNSTSNITTTGTITGGNIDTGGRASIAGNVIGNIFQSTNLTLQAPGQGDYAGERLRLYDFADPAKVNYAIGVETSAIWFGVDTNLEGQGFKWYGNNVPVMRLSGIGNLSVAGNVVANANITGANINTAGLVTATGNITGGNVQTAGLITATGNITGGNVATTGLVTAAGNITGANIITAGNVSATGNISADYFIGNGRFLDGIDTTLISNGTTEVRTLEDANVTVTVAGSANIAVFSTGGVSVAGNVDGGNVNLTGLASVTGNVTGGNIVTAGLVTATGNIDTAAGISAAGDITADNATFTGTLVVPDISVNVLTSDDSTAILFNDGAIIEGDLEVNSTISSAGNVTAPNFIGNIIGNISGNITVGGANTEVLFNDDGLANASANLTFDKSTNVLSVAGTVRSQDISATGTISSTGSITATGNVQGGNVNTAGTVSAVGNVRGGNINSDAAVSAVAVTAATVDATTVTATNIVANRLRSDDSTFVEIEDGVRIDGSLETTGTISSTGNVTAPNFIGNVVGNITGNITVGGNNTEVLFNDDGLANAVSGLTFDKDTDLLTVAGNISGANLVTGGVVSAAGNVTGGNISTAGLVTAVGNLMTSAGISAAGNIVTAQGMLATDIGAFGFVSAAGNIHGGTLISDGLITGDVLEIALIRNTDSSFLEIEDGVTVDGDALITGLISASGNIAGDHLDIASNAIIGGDLIVNGNLSYVNIDTLAVEDPIIGLGRGPNNSPLTTDDGRDRGSHLWYYDGAEKGAFFGFQNSSGNMFAATDVSITNEVVTINSFGSFDAGDIYASSLSVSGNVIGGNVNTSGLLSTTGNIVGGNISTSGLIEAIGNIEVGNVKTENLSLAGNVLTTFNSTSNITTSANIAAAYFIGNGSQLDGLTPNKIFNGTSEANIGVASGNANISIGATSNVAVFSADGVRLTGLVSASGNITGANVDTAGLITATGNIQGANLRTTGLVTASGNITGGNISTAGRLSAAGNLIGSNVTTAGTVSAASVVATSDIDTVQLTVNRIRSDDSTFVSVEDGLQVEQSLEVVGNITGANVNTVDLSVSGNIISPINVSGNVTAGNILTSGLVSATGNVTGGNVRTAGAVSVGGNIEAGNIISNGVIDATSDVLALGNVSASGNVLGGNVITSGVVSAGSASAAGNITGANFVTAGQVTATGNVTGGNLNTSGSGYATGVFSAAGNIIGGNVVSAARVDGVTLSATGNVVGGNITTIGQVSATGNVTGGNINTTGTLSTTGLTVTNGLNSSGLISGAGNIVSATNVIAPTLIGNLQGNISLSGSNTELLFNDGGLVGSDTGLTYDKVTNALSVGGTVGINNNGNLNVSGFISAAGNILTGSGNVSAGNVLTGGIASATGNVTGGNIRTTGVVTATGNITGGNVNTVLLAATTVSATANVVGGNVTTAGLITATGNVTSGNVNTAGVVTATGNVTGGNINAGSVVSAVANVVGGNISTAGLVTATGNVTGGNVKTAGIVSATSNIVSAANIAGGNIIGTDAVYGNIFTTLIDSDDSSIITVVPDVNFLASVNIDTDLIVGQDLTAPRLFTSLVDSTDSSTIVVTPDLQISASLTVDSEIVANTIVATTAINIGNSRVATVDDATALAIALG